MEVMSDEEKNEMIEELKDYYKSITLPSCESCKTNDQVIPCVYGRPSLNMWLYVGQGYAEFMGCVISNNSPVAKCKRCNQYIDEPKEQFKGE